MAAGFFNKQIAGDPLVGRSRQNGGPFGRDTRQTWITLDLSLLSFALPSAQFLARDRKTTKGATDDVLPDVRSGEHELSKTAMITIVDDDEAVRASTKALVRSLGYNARAFSSAEEFLDANLDDISCLILDIQMKGLSGVELQKLLNAQSRHTPIIFVTAFPDERTRNDVLNAGAIGFLSKPYSNEKLAKFLDMALAN